MKLPYIGTIQLLRLLEAGIGVEQLMHGAVMAGDTGQVLMRMAQLFHIHGDSEQSWQLQLDALQQRRHYQMAADRQPASLRLLVILTTGFMLDNTPVEFLLEGSSIACELLYITEHLPLPEFLPPHDVAFIAIGHFARYQPLFERLQPLLAASSAPVLNRPQPGFSFDRDRLNQLLQGVGGAVVPLTRVVRREQLRHLTDWPLIVRPLRSHAGIGLQRLDGDRDVVAYLVSQSETEFYVAPYVDYRSPDGNYRKCRLLMLRGVPYICHLAISSHWVVHYRSAGMGDSEDKREEENCFMNEATSGFCHRHAAALAEIATRIGLDYFVMDCAETRDGRLLFFEADNISLIHAADPVDVFPYKQTQMACVFQAFRQVLSQASRAAGVKAQQPP